GHRAGAGDGSGGGPCPCARRRPCLPATVGFRTTQRAMAEVGPRPGEASTAALLDGGHLPAGPTGVRGRAGYFSLRGSSPTLQVHERARVWGPALGASVLLLEAMAPVAARCAPAGRRLAPRTPER